MERKSCAVAGILIFLLAIDASAAELRAIDFSRDGDRYTLRSVTWFDADVAAVYSVLIDYDQSHRFSGAITESRNLAPDDEGRPEYFTRMEDCILIWCQSFDRVGYLKLEPIHRIEAFTDPERSDFKMMRERWQREEVEEGTLLTYKFEMVPDFWVPPLLGPYLIKRALITGGRKAANRLEVIAIEEAVTQTVSEP